MPSSISIDLDLVAKDLNLPPAKVQRTVQLLDEGNTVPFITRYRKDQTGGLNEEQIQKIQQVTTKMRLLAERKQTILKSIESQGKLTPKLAARIRDAGSTKRLEDLYLPYKPKKRTLATLARERGLEPFAREILEGAPLASDLDARAGDFVSPDRELNSPAEVLHGVGHLMAERFSEHAEVRSKLRRMLQRTGHLVTSKVEAPGRQETKPSDTEPKPAPAEVAVEKKSEDGDAPETDAPETEATATTAAVPGTQPAGDSATRLDTPSVEVIPAVALKHAPPEEASVETPATAEQDPPEPESVSDDARKNAEPARGTNSTKATTAKGRKRQKLENAFKDYFDYRESISRIPPHRVLAINRGERARVLRVRIESDSQAMAEQATTLLVADDHPHAEFLRACARDALMRLVLPSLEREIRRELTDKAEDHAVQVFIRNLRKLMLQPPVHGRRVLAVDPGYRSGCKLAAMDEFGNILESGVIHIIGNEAKRATSRASLVEMIRRQGVQVVAIGNGTACRETEQLVADLLADELKDDDVAYVIVNEAGASTYSTSPAGREELPDYDAVLRSAISIGRRLLDPLSELVKINPANIGVGLYQHDVKAKHLRDSLDDVVALCVNFVGVDVNSASPALLSYVSGLNQLTARRLYDYRRENGPFRARTQLRDVPGIGESSFVQAAGFLRITDGDNPLDATWIHPESYDVAQRVLTKLDSSVDELAGMLRSTPTLTVPEPETVPAASDGTVGEPATPAKSLVERADSVDISVLAAELDVGEMLLKDILTSLIKPGRDPREDLPPPTFRRGIVKLEDLKPGMELSGTVLNVVDFGAFVDIGISDGALVHISRLADRYVKDPHEVVSVGDILTVWVIDVDKQRRRVSLTAIQPGSEPMRRDERHAPARRKKSTQPHGARKPKGSGRSSPPRRAKTGPPKRAKKKPAKPITDAMAEGREPMRSFSDLVQFYEQKREPPDDKESTSTNQS